MCLRAKKGQGDIWVSSHGFTDAGYSQAWLSDLPWLQHPAHITRPQAYPVRECFVKGSFCSSLRIAQCIYIGLTVGHAISRRSAELSSTGSFCYKSQNIPHCHNESGAGLRDAQHHEGQLVFWTIILHKDLNRILTPDQRTWKKIPKQKAAEQSWKNNSEQSQRDSQNSNVHEAEPEEWQAV